MSKFRWCALLVVLGAHVVACAPFTPTDSPSAGVAQPTRSAIGSIPTPASPSIPVNQQQAQDTVLELLQNTADALPEGSVLDGSNFTADRLVRACEDGSDSATSAVRVEDWRDIRLPDGTDDDMAITRMADSWRQWGWSVSAGSGDRDRSGVAPDGYVLHVETGGERQSLLLIGASPCYASGLLTDAPRNPVSITPGTR